ncbi:hypothetical protein [uncultured Paraglaciecola sp.]|uniref:portal protein n=1 Tax=uncultured Paraglaciecola sp. TaxID=1765024 RepID=UPI002621AC02|nr:hypothetical protein [uncultured Paraglaciecola sp.]
MRKEDLAAIVYREVTQARGYDSDTLSAARKAALDLYEGRMTAAPEGRSQAISLDVADSVHAILAQIAPVVRTSQIEFEPQSQEDEQAAQMETDFVQVSIERASGFDVLDDSIFDALLVGNGWLHVHVDEETTETEQRFPPNLTDEQLFVLRQTIQADSVSIKETDSETIATITTTNKKLVVESVPPEDMLFSEEGSGYEVDQVRFVARKRLYTASALKEKGAKQEVIDSLPDAVELYDGDIARQGIYQADGDYRSVQEANRLKRVYVCYIRLQEGMANKTQLREVWVGENGSDILFDEPADFIPFICGSAIPMPHRIVGTGIGQLLAQVQNQKTHVLRQYMDNLAVLNASRVGAVEGQVNMSDLTNGRINGIVRMRSPDAIVPLPASDIGPQAISALNYLDQVRTQRVGAALDFNEVQAQLMGTSATAAAGQLSKVEQLGGWFAGNIVKTMFMPLFQLVHKTLRTELAGPVMAKIGGKWQQTDTSQWQARHVTDIHMGLTTTEKAERLSALTQVLGQLQSMISTGGNGVITDTQRIYSAMSDWIRTANLGPADQYLIDPTSEEAQQALQQQSQEQRAQAEDQLRIQVEEIKLNQNFDLEKQSRDLAYKEWSDRLSAEIEEAKLTVDSTIKVKELNINKRDETDDDTD